MYVTVQHGHRAEALEVAEARAPSSVPQPHAGYTLHSGTCANTTIGVLLERCFTSRSIQSSCSAPNDPKPTRFQIENVYESHEMDSAVVEAVPAAAVTCPLCVLPIALQVARTAIYAYIMFSRNVEGFPGASFPQNLICRVELGRLRELRDIARVEEKRGLDLEGIDLGDRRPKGRGHIVVRGFVEADVTVAYLHEEELALLRCLSTEARRAGDASADRPQQACPDPCHAAQEVAPIDAVRVERGSWS